MPTTAPSAISQDKNKRVNYTLGLVLGVDEFQQEQLYFMERDRLHHRALHGYGTAWGLALGVRSSDDGPEVVVRPGMAVDPHGQHICIGRTQCASLEAWLNRDDIREGIDGESVEAFVTLCYREGTDDRVPVPGGPCRSQEESLVASRITDDFELQLSLDPPPHIEETAIRRFGDLLAQIEVSEAEPSLTEEELIDLVLALAEPVEPPPDDEPPDETEPEPLILHPDDACDFLRAAFRVWVTDVRPALLGPGCCGGAYPGDDCVLLGVLRFDVEEDAGGLRIVTGESEEDEPVEVDEDDRPYLLTTRLLQEWQTCGRRANGVTSHSDLGDLDADDHEQYFHRDGRRPLTGTLDADGNTLANVAEASAAGEAMPHGQAAGGDLADAYPAPRVVGLQTTAIADLRTDDFAPSGGEVLTWNGDANDGAGHWEPRPASGGGEIDPEDILDVVARRLPTLPLATIRPDDGTDIDIDEVPARAGFLLWFHLFTGPLDRDNVPEIVTESVREGLRVFAERRPETSSDHPFLEEISVQAVVPGTERNTVFVVLSQRATQRDRFRFRFQTDAIGLQTEDGGAASLAEWIERQRFKWVGHDGEEAITVFVENARSAAPSASGYVPVAAGTFGAEGEAERDTLGNLRVRRQSGEGVFEMTFDGYTPNGNYVVTGAPLVSDPGGPPFGFEVLVPFQRTGLSVRVVDVQNQPPQAGFMMQVFEIS